MNGDRISPEPNCPSSSKSTLDLVISVNRQLQPAVEALLHARVEIMLALGLHWAGNRDLGLLGRAVVQRERGWSDQLLRRRRKVARVADMEGRQGRRIPDEVGARTELRFMRECADDVVTRAVVERQVRRELPFVLEVDSVQLPVLAVLVGDRERNVAGLIAVGGDRKYGRDKSELVYSFWKKTPKRTVWL